MIIVINPRSCKCFLAPGRKICTLYSYSIILLWNLHRKSQKFTVYSCFFSICDIHYTCLVQDQTACPEGDTMNIFSYESKPMQILTFLGDLIFLNFAYLLCCLPIFTIGAAQAGLYTAIKVLTDPEDDSSAMAAFFRGFTSGFGTVTVSWGIVTLVLALIAAAGYTALAYGASLWVIGIALALIALYQSLIPAFHSRFGCTIPQLLRNTFFLIMGYPLQSLLAAVLIWLPVIVFLCNAVFFMELTPIWGTLYFSTACLFAYTFLKKPFKTLIEQFNAGHPQEEAPVTESKAVFKDVPELEENND